MATSITGYWYFPKVPLADGTIYACGGGGSWVPTPPEERRRGIVKEINNISDKSKYDQDHPNTIANLVWWKELLRKHDLENGKQVQNVYVPDGAFDWLLHEVGHFIAASPSERLLPNYGLGPEEVGHGADREWQAWAFQEIIMAPYGYARELTPPSYRAGVGYSKSGPMPAAALDWADKQMRALKFPAETWQSICGEWHRWGMSRILGHRPWDSVN